MGNLWYYSHAQARFGPYSPEQMRALANSGTILPTDTVYKGGVERGLLASKVKNLFGGPAIQLPDVVTAPPPGLVEVAVMAQAEIVPLTVPALLPPEPKAAPAEVSVAELTAPALAPDQTPTPPRRPVYVDRQANQQKGRATAGNGVTIVSQDGVDVRFRKKCTTCQHEDNATHSVPIRNGRMSMSFFCTKCRKNRPVEILGSLH